MDVVPGTGRREKAAGRGPRNKARGSRLAGEANQTEKEPLSSQRGTAEGAS